MRTAFAKVCGRGIWMNKWLQALVLTCLPVFVAAETIQEAYGLGNANPVPAEWTKIDEILSVRVQILDASTGKLIEEAKIGQKLRIGVDFYIQPGAEDRDITLECSIYFYDANGDDDGPDVDDQPCYQGRLLDGLEQFRPVDAGFVFRPKMGSALGTWAAVVRVQDTVPGNGISVAPTFRVKGK